MSDSFQTEASRQAIQVKRITWIGLAVNLFLAVIKFVVGIIGSSQVVVADAFHSLSDMGTDLAVLLGVNFWTAPADEEHPYGHWRIETLITAVIAAMASITTTIKISITVKPPFGSRRPFPRIRVQQQQDLESQCRKLTILTNLSCS